MQGREGEQLLGLQSLCLCRPRAASEAAALLLLNFQAPGLLGWGSTRGAGDHTGKTYSTRCQHRAGFPSTATVKPLCVYCTLWW